MQKQNISLIYNFHAYITMHTHTDYIGNIHSHLATIIGHSS